jgi:site-specific recombinase XerD
MLLYGAGLRLQECMELRVKDVDFERREITVRRGKGQKDRRVMLPEAVRSLLASHLPRASTCTNRSFSAQWRKPEGPPALPSGGLPHISP